MQFEGVLFDMDGLMFDTERMSDELWISVCARHGRTITPQDVALLRGQNRAGGRAAFLRRFGADFPYDACVGEVAEMLRARLSVRVPLRPGLMELLCALRQRGIPAAVASSTHRALVESNLRTAGVAEYFKALVCGDEVERSKPAPDIFLRAAALLGAPPAACLVLEDSYNGIRAGAAAGCYAVMVPDMDPPTPEMQTLARRIVPSLLDVIPLLDEAAPLE